MLLWAAFHLRRSSKVVAYDKFNLAPVFVTAVRGGVFTRKTFVFLNPEPSSHTDDESSEDKKAEFEDDDKPPASKRKRAKSASGRRLGKAVASIIDDEASEEEFQDDVHVIDLPIGHSRGIYLTCKSCSFKLSGRTECF